MEKHSYTLLKPIQEDLDEDLENGIEYDIEESKHESIFSKYLAIFNPCIDWYNNIDWYNKVFCCSIYLTS